MSSSNSRVISGIGARFSAVTNRLLTFSNAFKYLVLLLSLQYLFATPYFLNESQRQTVSILREGRFIDYLWAYSDLLFTLLGGIFAVSRRMRTVLPAVLIAVLAITTIIMTDKVQTQQTLIAADLAMIAFFLFTALIILHDIWTTRAVTVDTIVGSVCVYVLIGATWSFFYTFAELLSPGSFIITSGRGVDKAFLTARHYPLFMYFSFMTLTSVGFGDIIPAKPAARLLAVWEAVFGQFYLAILVARLVAIHIAHPSKDARKDYGN